MVLPVMLPPGQARLATRPARTASPMPIITIGMVVVAAWAGRWGAEGRNQVDWTADELAHHRRQAVGRPLAVAVFIVDGLALDVAEFAQCLPKGLPHRRVIDDADTRNFCLLLGACADRP